jgi:Leucine-rich repeat (LRR) protein
MLNASFNKITAMPLLPSRGKLDRVYFGENALKELDMDSLLHSANSITELLVQGNQLTQCPDRIYLLNCLKVLDMSNNCLSNLPPALGYMPTLSKILMEGNAIRTIRRPLLSSPQAEDLKVFLRTRGPPPTEQSVRVRTHSPSQSPSHYPFTRSLAPSSIKSHHSPSNHLLHRPLGHHRWQCRRRRLEDLLSGISCSRAGRAAAVEDEGLCGE